MNRRPELLDIEERVGRTQTDRSPDLKHSNA